MGFEMVVVVLPMMMVISRNMVYSYSREKRYRDTRTHLRVEGMEEQDSGPMRK
jgi:hypothetical protein